ncbi:MAG: hypothetical protein GX275_12465 [Clostridiales bacterium]|nr:hypothetical protein [Clostridiales bacterium]
MSRTKTLTKYFVKNALDEMFNSNGKMKPIVKMALMILLIMLVSIPFSAMVGMYYPTLKLVNQEGMIIAMLLSSGVFITFFFGVYTILNIFYFSNDVEQLLPLPFKPNEIIFGKFITVYINMLLYSFMLIVPLTVYGVMSGGGILYYLYMVIAIIIIPIVPIVVATIVSMILMRFTHLSKHKDAFKMISGCISLILVVVFNFFMQGSGDNNEDYLVTSLREGDNSLIGKASGYMIINKFINIALVNSDKASGFLYILLAIVLSICIYGIFYIISGKIYFKGIIGISESYSKRESILDKGKTSKLLRRNSPIKALVLRDIKIIFRTPQFFMNSVAMLLYMPAIFGVMFFANGSIDEIKGFIQSMPTNGIVLAASFIIAAIFISAGGAGICALSREGKDFIISKYIPVDYRNQLKSKIISSLAINESITVILIAFMIYLGIKPGLLILSAIVIITTVGLITMIGLFIDFKSPKLDWEDEKALMKNNFSPVIIMVIMMVIGIILLIISFFVHYLIMFLIILLVNTFMIWFCYNRLLVLAEKIYNDN